MSKSSRAVIEWRKRTKARIVDSMGGKCAICGYKKHHEVLELHHMDPSKKKFSFGSIRANPKSWSTIVEELRKCVLLCSNCHKEVEAGYVNIEHKEYFIEEYSDPKFFTRNQIVKNQYSFFEKKYKEKICVVCKELFVPTSGKQKRCSQICEHSQIA